ncbi:hypothetical protein MIND_01125400 [Mycena indigotica]|uniref:Uncharacterized protein n=1 Tax=Mycena indigotica TaxID=2126181 RepID=A0A8H6VTL7_9AGAR|nr:uncharacterized protein MIND_01125400 [Mycena indigotica]KAF7293477.1 hypothetical protein MIND_01125400 [Mycena indigotica]
MVRIQIPASKTAVALECYNIPELAYASDQDPLLEPGAFVRCGLNIMREEHALGKASNRQAWQWIWALPVTEICRLYNGDPRINAMPPNMQVSNSTAQAVTTPGTPDISAEDIEYMTGHMNSS